MNHNKSKPKILVIHGPNLNMLGKREPEIYGKTTLDEIDSQLEALGATLGIIVETFQSNHEGAIVDKIQEAATAQNGMIINPGALTHTSIAIRDALLALDVPIIEIHISNIGCRRRPDHRTGNQRLQHRIESHGRIDSKSLKQLKKLDNCRKNNLNFLSGKWILIILNWVPACFFLTTSCCMHVTLLGYP